MDGGEEIKDERDKEKFEFWERVLQGAKYVVAPMVDQSELAWRMLSRSHGAQLCYSPMFHASVFIRDENYRKDALLSCPEDRPLIVQFCANDPNIFLQAALLAQDSCDAIDLNLGCPQSIAKRGHYGAYLQNEWDVIYKMINLCSTNLKVPVTCKIRVFEDKNKTVRFAQMLEKAGVSLLTVHGRTREMKGASTGVADWNAIKVVKQSVRIPVFANGNIQYFDDIDRCLNETNVEGVMSAEGNLHNPALFSGLQPHICEMSEEYLTMVHKYPCPLSYVRGHLFKLWLHALQVHIDLRLDLGRAKKLEAIVQVHDELKQRCQDDMKTSNGLLNGKLPLPYWICQPFVRISPAESKKLKQEKSLKRPLASIVDQDKNHEGLSKNQIKKRMRNPDIKFDTKGPRKGRQFTKCANCANPRGLRCIFEFCRSCCKSKAHKMMVDCPGHHLYFKSKQEKRLKWEAEQKEKQRLSQELECHVTEVEIESIKESDQNQDKEIQQTESRKKKKVPTATLR